jgi:hypothetical protein
MITDIVEGARISKSSDGTEIVRIIQLEELSGDPRTRVASSLNTPGLPRIGDPHPAIPGARVVDVSIEFSDPENAEATITYRTPTSGNAGAEGGAGSGVSVLSIEFAAATASETTARDRRGALMVNKYQAENFTQQVIEVDKLMPQFVVRIRHTRPDLPKAIAARFVGAVNGDPWGGFPPHTWLCTGLTTERDGNEIVCVLEAVYKPDSWRIPSVVTIDGVPVILAQLDVSQPKDADGSGIATYEIYRPERFADLSLPW